jgi:hypothetical protein
MDRKIPAKALSAMIRKAVSYCFFNRETLKKRIVLRHFKRRASIVVALVSYNNTDATMEIIVVTMLRGIMRLGDGETVIDLLKNGDEQIYENKIKTGERKMENPASVDEPRS